MANLQGNVIGGVDTHKFTHYAAAIDDHGRLLDHAEFPANGPGYQQLLEWMRRFGRIETIGVESSGSFGAALVRFLRAAGEEVAEVNKPNRQARHMQGKSDRLDAEQIARPSWPARESELRRPSPVRSRSSACCGWPERAPFGPARRPLTTFSAP